VNRVAIDPFRPASVKKSCSAWLRCALLRATDRFELFHDHSGIAATDQQPVLFFRRPVCRPALCHCTMRVKIVFYKGLRLGAAGSYLVIPMLKALRRPTFEEMRALSSAPSAGSQFSLFHTLFDLVLKLLALPSMTWFSLMSLSRSDKTLWQPFEMAVKSSF
jgi:hypothetical protein